MGKGKGKSVRITRYNSMTELRDDCYVIEDISLPEIGHLEVPVIKGNLGSLPKHVQEFIAQHVRLCRPKGIYICDGSEDEREEITEKCVTRGMLTKLDKYENCLGPYAIGGAT